MSEYGVEVKNLTKRFPGVVALKNMSIGIRPGEIHGLIGENGAGKSTLIKVLTGVHTPEEGEIYVDGQKVVFHNPVQSREAGIACVYQELNIVKQLSVTDNVFMGRAVKKNGLLDYPRMYEEAKQALTTLGHPEIDVKMECGKLRHGAVWERRFSKNESRLAGGIPSGEAYGPPNGGYGVPAPTSGRICPATSWLSFPVQWDTHAGPAGPILQQSIDWRTRSCHITFPLSPWAAPRIR